MMWRRVLDLFLFTPSRLPKDEASGRNNIWNEAVEVKSVTRALV